MIKYFLIFRGNCLEDIDASCEIPLPGGWPWEYNVPYLELNPTPLALLRLGWDPKRVIRLYIWGFEEAE
jgi:hypothetical protein